LGAFVRLDVALADGTAVRVELTRERYAALEPRIGETLFVAPRDLKVFLDPSQQSQPVIS
jgi:sulfate transport system ATP-binding protein